MSEHGFTFTSDNVFGLPYSSVKGKPFIVVSSKGIANGTSNIPNGGADFGPDTPNTQTSGIQEAFDYSNLTGHSIEISAGSFPVSAPIIWNYVVTSGTISRAKGIEIKGAGNPQIQNFGQPSLLGGTIIYPTPDFPANEYMFQFGNSSTIIKFLKFSDITINCLPNNSTVPGASTGLSGGIAVFNGEDVLIDHCGVFWSSLDGIHVWSNTSGGTAAISNCFTWSSYGNGILNSTSESYVIACSSFYDGISANNVASINIGIPDASPSSIVTAVGCTVNVPQAVAYQVYSGSLIGCNIDGSPGKLAYDTLALDGVCTIVGGSYYNCVAGSGHGLVNVQLSGSLNIVKITGAIFSFGSNMDYVATAQSSVTFDNCHFNLNGFTLTELTPTPAYVTFHEVTGISLSPATPSVPASGTALQNTNPYKVSFFVNGGTVTEIQITRGGTAYTVLSNSTGISLSSFPVTLEPGDSITLTYTTAPTWTDWMPE